MADGTYERREPREMELKRLQRLIAEARGAARPGTASLEKTETAK